MALAYFHQPVCEMRSIEAERSEAGKPDSMKIT